MHVILLAPCWVRDMQRRANAIHKQQLKVSVLLDCLSSNAMPACRRCQNVTRCFRPGLSIFTVCFVCTPGGCPCVELTAELLHTPWTMKWSWGIGMFSDERRIPVLVPAILSRRRSAVVLLDVQRLKFHCLDGLLLCGDEETAEGHVNVVMSGDMDPNHQASLTSESCRPFFWPSVSCPLFLLASKIWRHVKSGMEKMDVTEFLEWTLGSCLELATKLIGVGIRIRIIIVASSQPRNAG